MRQITVIFHHADDAWWAESPDLPGFSALAPTLESLRREVRSGVEFELEGEPHLVLETAASSARWGTRIAESNPTAGANATTVSVANVGYRASTLPRSRALNARLAVA